MMSASTHLRNLGEYNKAIAAGIGSVILVLTAILGFSNVIPETLAGWVTGALAVLTTAAVFMVKNQTAIDRFGDSAADLLDR